MDLSVLLLAATFGSAFFGFQLLKEFHARPPVVDPVPGTETWTVEEIEALRHGAEEIGVGLRRQVGIVATAGAGADGPLTTPDGGVECVWWRWERIRYYVKWVDGKEIEGTERIGHNWSRSAFTLSDETGTVVVRPADADVIGAEEVYSRPEEVEPDGSALGALLGRETTTDVVYRERALRAGATVFVHGEAHDLDEQFVTIAKPLDDKPFIISTEEERLLRGVAGKQRSAAEAKRMWGYGLLALAPVLFVLFYLV
jgi:hypothetical protein